MRFFIKFSRFVGVPGPALGSDVTPTAQPNTSTMDNLLVSQVTSMNAGWPVHRIAVVCKAPPGTPPLPATLKFYEELTDTWYGVGGIVSLVPGEVRFFDTVGLLDRPPTGANQFEARSGGLHAVLIPTDPGGVPAGEITFALGPDLTTF